MPFSTCLIALRRHFIRRRLRFRRVLLPERFLSRVAARLFIIGFAPRAHELFMIIGAIQYACFTRGKSARENIWRHAADDYDKDAYDIVTPQEAAYYAAMLPRREAPLTSF